MYMKRETMKVAMLSVLTVFILAMCATKIPLTVQRTPTMDTLGIKRIAIRPFTANGYQSAATYATTVATSRIQATNHFTLVEYSPQNPEGNVDAVFSGQIINIGHNTTQKTAQRTDRTTGVTTTYYYYVMEVEVNFNYSFTRSRDGSLIGPVNRKGSTSVQADSSSDLPSVDTLANRVIDNQLRYLGRDVAPYTITVTRKMEKEPNKDLRPRMDSALAQVKGGSYKAALDSYLSIYSTNKNIAAAINASILYEALGETMSAATFMQEVYSSTGNPKASEVLARLNNELNQMAGTAEYSDTRNQTEKVAAYAGDEIQKVLPVNAKVWISNNSGDNVLAKAVVDNITADFIKKGINLVDRENITLIEAEQNLQLSGFTSDNDFVSVGNAVGANIIAIIAVTGTGDMRRLQLRVLDIEKGIPILQSDTSDVWKL